MESRVADIGERACLVLGIIERDRKGNEGGERGG